MNRIPWDVERHRAAHARTVYDPDWAQRPTRLEPDGTIILQGWPLYRCPTCNRQHLKFTTKVCPCGTPFPHHARQEVCR
jgi:hypothetical protein